MPYLPIISKSAFLRTVLLVLILMAVTAGRAFAQHCPYDGATIIILDIRAVTDGPIIQGQRVTMIDSAGAPVISFDAPLRFHQNPKRTTQTGYIDNENPLQPEKI